MIRNNADKLFVRLALKEDLGKGDITTNALGIKGITGKAVVIAKSEGIVSGIEQFKLVFKSLSPQVTFKTYVNNSKKVLPGERLILAKGPLDCLLIGERTAMNIISHLCLIQSGIRRWMRKNRSTLR